MTGTGWKNANTAAALQGAVAVVLLAIGAWQGIGAITSEQGIQRLRPYLNLEAFLSGRLTGAVNTVLVHDLPADPLLRAAGGVLRYELFASGGPQVRVGCDDTLFLTEELRPWPEPGPAMTERAEGVRRVKDALAARGIALAVAIVPDKARVLAKQLCGAPLSAQAMQRHDDFLAALRGKGIDPVALLPALQEQEARGGAWYRTDTHWNQEGAKAAAAAIAKALRDTPLSRAEDYRTSVAAEDTNGPGDLLRLMSLDHVPDALRPAPDRQRLERTEMPESGGGLLDETPAPEVALIGSSYSLNANFHGALQAALRGTVLNAATAGGGFAGAATTYFAGQSFRESPPKLVIWEIPERVVAQPLTQAERDFIARW
ncbi:alginate O-acetyltransferase AlgX-related protein [Roseomonas xinghualingensis]|uniref:alginate O-acetyltransferase AlgX-related protein n=1 Tax=Roseomonas xinghualingensis TaxID=2986475 RepID=UPI0021F1930B|nr:cell division protein FtsQ [Roseomonas sp. SXEYE001]MCV4208662.1 cell division protein FtsQ [Roseomonas sp. SXEYE001]